MLKDIVMGKVFKLPVMQVCRNIDDTQVTESSNDGVMPWDCIDHAVNSYDELVQENKRLKALLSQRPR